jgi:5-formyltetrahydrofolate cyclo-ligase
MTDIAQQKQKLRDQLQTKYRSLWPQGTQPERPPVFSGHGKAAEQLRRTNAYRMAKVVAAMPDPILLQARINLLNDNKTLVAATPGLKKGLLRIMPPEVPFAQRNRLLTGHAMFEVGQHLRFPGARAGKIDMLLGPCLAVDPKGVVLGDGRGLLDLTGAILGYLKALAPEAPLVVLADDKQIEASLPSEEWDLPADIIVTPSQVITCKAKRPEPKFKNLPQNLARLPLLRGVLGDFDF